MNRLFALALLAGCTAGDPEVPFVVAPTPPTVEAASLDGASSYAVRVEPEAHLAHVELRLDTEGADALTLVMARWTPGSYLIREYAQQVSGLEVVTLEGEVLPLEMLDPSRWTAHVAGHATVVVRYRVFAHDLDVRHDFLDPQLGFLNGAPTFITVEGRLDRPHEVRFALPEGWRLSSLLEAHPDGDPAHRVARDFDALVDGPTVMGPDVDVHPFEVAGVPHELVLVGDAGHTWDVDRAVSDLEVIVFTAASTWGEIPYGSYRFLAVLGETGGGLEHRDGTLLLTSRWATSTREDYRRWLGLAAHEHLHAWNVKRLRPEGLGPFDYTREPLTPSLWFAEGLTSYYDEILLVRAGLLTEDELLEDLSDTLGKLQERPGRTSLSLADASRQAWIRRYRPHENRRNDDVDYYRKGALVGLILDAAIRRETNGGASLDDVMRRAWEVHGRTGVAYTEDDLRAIVAEVSSDRVARRLQTMTETTRELDLGATLDWLGLRFTPPAPTEEVPGTLGADLESRSGRWIVSGVPADGPAARAGLSVGDELVALDDQRIPEDGAEALLQRLGPGDRRALVARRGQILALPLTLLPPPTRGWTMEVDPDASWSAEAHRSSWLDGSP